MNPEPWQEHRKYVRIKKHFILTYYNLADPLQRHDASQLKNISIGGICLITGRTFPAGTKLGIDLKTPFAPDLIHLEGRVLDSIGRIQDIIFETRVEFTSLPESSKHILGLIIEHFKKEESKNENQ